MLKSTIIRVLAFAALFAYILPAVFSLTGFGSSFAFTGSIIAALGVGVAYMVAMFAVLAVIAVVSKPLGLTDEKKNKLAPLWSTIFGATTMALLLGAQFVPVLGLTVVGWLPAMISSIIAIGVMAITMPSKLAK